MQHCFRIGAFAGLKWVKERRLWLMLKLVGLCSLIGQKLATGKVLLICSWRWVKHLYIPNGADAVVANPFLWWHGKLNTVQDYEKACDAFLDGLKLDPANAEMENALRYLSPALCRCSDKGLLGHKLTLIVFITPPCMS